MQSALSSTETLIYTELFADMYHQFQYVLSHCYLIQFQQDTAIIIIDKE